MATIISDPPKKVCPSCGCVFTYTKADIERDTTQEWMGFFQGGWVTVEKRYLVCPGCGKHIKLR